MQNKQYNSNKINSVSPNFRTTLGGAGANTSSGMMNINTSSKPQLKSQLQKQGSMSAGRVKLQSKSNLNRGRPHTPNDGMTEQQNGLDQKFAHNFNMQSPMNKFRKKKQPQKEMGLGNYQSNNSRNENIIGGNVGLMSTPNQHAHVDQAQGDTVQMDSRMTTAQKAASAFQIDQAMYQSLQKCTPTKQMTKNVQVIQNQILQDNVLVSMQQQLSAQKLVHQQQSAAAQQQPKYEVYMRCVTWSRDSHGLFDYESKNIAKKNIKTQTGGKILRVKDDVEFVSIRTRPEEIDPEAKPMIIVRQQNGGFQIQNDTIVSQTPRDQNGEPISDEDINNKMFVVVRNTKSAQNNLDYKLNRGDTIKFGRIKFNVKDYRSSKYSQSACKKECDQINSGCDGHEQQMDQIVERSTEMVGRRIAGTNQTPQKNLINDNSLDSLNEEFEEEAIEIDCGVVDPTNNPDIQCKVCWDNTSTIENPLLNSCQCDGSVRFIHYECLKFWLKQKMIKKEDKNLISYTWKQFECEICKKPYPYVFRSNGIPYRLTDVEADIPADGNYLMLESLTFEKNSSRMIHLIKPDEDKQTFKLGRGHESDVRVSDISVSRCHALIKFNPESGRYYLEDNLSKFGTLVLAKGQIDLDLDMTKAVQIGRSVVSFTVKTYMPPPPAISYPETQKQMQPLICGGNDNQIVEKSANCKNQNFKTPSPAKLQVTGPPQEEQPSSFQLENLIQQQIQETNKQITDLMQQAIIEQDATHGFSQNKNRQSKQSLGNLQEVGHGLIQESQFNKPSIERNPSQDLDQFLESQENMISDDLDTLGKQIQEVFGIDLMQMQDSEHNLNIRHLLKATNHLRIAQREFQIAKQLSSGKKNSNQILFANEQQPYRQQEYLCQSSSGILKLSQHDSAPTQSLRKVNTMNEVTNFQKLQRRSSHLDEQPYGQSQRNQLGNMARGNMVYSSSKNNLSDQKTPGRHPNSFLYRAHLNLNEEKACESNNQIIDEMVGHMREQQQNRNGTGPQQQDVSDFVQNELDDLQNAATCARPKLRKQDLTEQDFGFNEQQDLRVKSSCQKLQDQLQKQQTREQRSSFEEQHMAQQPIMELMRLHRHQFIDIGQLARAPASPNAIKQGKSSDLGLGLSIEQREKVNGRSNSNASAIFKSPSSPSKIFREHNPFQNSKFNDGQLLPNAADGTQSQKRASYQFQSFSKSPFRKDSKIAEFNLKSQLEATLNTGGCQSHLQKRDRSEVTQTSVGPPPQQSNGQKSSNSVEKRANLQNSGTKSNIVNYYREKQTQKQQFL